MEQKEPLRAGYKVVNKTDMPTTLVYWRIYYSAGGGTVHERACNCWARTESNGEGGDFLRIGDKNDFQNRESLG